MTLYNFKSENNICNTNTTCPVCIVQNLYEYNLFSFIADLLFYRYHVDIICIKGMVYHIGLFKNFRISE